MASRDDNNDIILLVDAVRSSRSSRVYHRHSVIGPTCDTNNSNCKTSTAGAHKARIVNHNQESGTGEGRRQKVEPVKDVGWKCNLEECL